MFTLVAVHLSYQPCCPVTKPEQKIKVSRDSLQKEVERNLYCSLFVIQKLFYLQQHKRGTCVSNTKVLMDFSEQTFDEQKCSVLLLQRVAAVLSFLFQQSENLYLFMASVSSAAFFFFKLCFNCRQEKDSKDEAAKAEKELEEIRKVIQESGGKLSNRVLQSDVSGVSPFQTDLRHPQDIMTISPF